MHHGTSHANRHRIPPASGQDTAPRPPGDRKRDTEAHSQPRLRFVDELRGLAVVLMVAWHTADGWLVDAARDTGGWRVLRLFGGLGAPMFLLLAGASVALAVHRARPDGRVDPHTLRSLLVRGAQIVLLGYGLRIQMWLVDSAGLVESGAWRAWLPLVAGLAAALYGLGRLAEGGRPTRTGLLSAAALALGLHQLCAVVPHRTASVLRVDVLQCIGTSVVVLGLSASALRTLRHPGRAIAVAAAVALATPLAQQLVPGVLPAPAAGFVARWEGGLARFPLFPWLAYVFFGAAIGTLWARSLPRGRLAHAVLGLTLFGAALAVSTSESVPHGYRLVQSLPELSTPLRVLYKTGLTLVVSGAIFALGRAVRLPLSHLGRASLVVYWAHLELAFGMLSRPVARALEPWGWLLGLAGTLLAMEALARFRIRIWPSIYARLRTSWHSRTAAA